MSSTSGSARNVGPNIRHYRLRAGLSHNELARAAGLSSVKMLETHGCASIDSLDAVAAALSRKLGTTITASDLLDPPSDEAMASWRSWRSSCVAAKRARQRRAG